ncbi:hypothetical protein [Syntrophomonas palmitatica]|uniref:hypothetical protein n=1 Tax=Syntrophomonas palmitatica TaxID=402877 RepID=UPI001A9A65CC|nr:hypothetical protein [Syntrophomonas palmitatica]
MKKAKNTRDPYYPLSVTKDIREKIPFIYVDVLRDEDEYRFPRRFVESHSFLLNAVLDIIGFNERGRFGRDIITLTELPYYEEFEIEGVEGTVLLTPFLVYTV